MFVGRGLRLFRDGKDGHVYVLVANDSDRGMFSRDRAHWYSKR